MGCCCSGLPRVCVTVLVVCVVCFMGRCGMRCVLWTANRLREPSLKGKPASRHKLSVDEAVAEELFTGLDAMTVNQQQSVAFPACMAAAVAEDDRGSRRIAPPTLFQHLAS